MGAKKSSPAVDTADREIVIARVIDAPRQLVWTAMTDPNHVVRWWGPCGFTTTIEEMDVRVGGTWKHVIHGPDGTDYPNSSVFREVIKLSASFFPMMAGRMAIPTRNSWPRGRSMH